MVPMLSPESVNRLDNLREVGVDRPWGVAVAAFHAAPEACVATVSGAAGVGGGIATDAPTEVWRDGTTLIQRTNDELHSLVAPK